LTLRPTCNKIFSVLVPEICHVASQNAVICISDDTCISKNIWGHVLWWQSPSDPSTSTKNSATSIFKSCDKNPICQEQITLIDWKTFQLTERWKSCSIFLKLAIFYELARSFQFETNHKISLLKGTKSKPEKSVHLVISKGTYLSIFHCFQFH